MSWMRSAFPRSVTVSSDELVEKEQVNFQSRDVFAGV